MAQQPEIVQPNFDEDPLPAPELTMLDERSIEFELLGIYLHEHPLQRYRQRLAAQRILGYAALEHARSGSVVAVAGINVVHQAPPTAKGFHFVTLEDEDGFINVIFRPHVYSRYRQVIRQTHLLYVEGHVQREGAVINVIAHRVQHLAPILIGQPVHA